MKNTTFPVIIKDGPCVITFTDELNGTFESGAVCVSSLSDMMLRVASGRAEIIGTLTITMVSFERVSGEYWAHHNTGRFIISEAEYTQLKGEIAKNGKFDVISRRYDSRQLAEILAVSL